jgi:hypothetical protein
LITPLSSSSFVLVGSLHPPLLIRKEAAGGIVPNVTLQAVCFHAVLDNTAPTHVQTNIVAIIVSMAILIDPDHDLATN